jgi:hypothetical protein
VRARLLVILLVLLGLLAAGLGVPLAPVHRAGRAAADVHHRPV